MASLALMVMLLMLSVLLCGPIVYLLSMVKFIPDVVVMIAAAGAIAYGFWWLMLPVWPTSLIGGIPIVFGFWALDRRYGKRFYKEHEDGNHE